MESKQERVEIPPYSFWTERSGSGTPVILIHGLSGSGRWWKRNVEALSKEHEVVAVDLVGFGRNRGFRPGSPMPLTFSEASGMLTRWLEQSFSEPVHLIGHSMGGQTAIHIAASRPDLVRSLTLVASTGIPFGLDPRVHLGEMAMPPAEAISFSRVLLSDFFRAGPSAVAVASARLLRDDAREAMRSVAAPTLLVWGEHDFFVPMKYAFAINELIPHAELVTIPDAAHVPMWDNAESFNTSALAFLRKVDASALPDTSQQPPGFTWGVSGSAAGLWHRESGPLPSVVLLHGLGIGNRYFSSLARGLSGRGIKAIAPDLPGSGFSLNVQTAPADHAMVLRDWARERRLPAMRWIAHSTGCQTLLELQSIAPDLVTEMIFMSPIWSRRRHPWSRLFTALIRDAVREPIQVLGYAAEAYWAAGLRRVLPVAFYHLRRSKEPITLPAGSKVIAGSDDALVDLGHLRELAGDALRVVPGTHAVHISSTQMVVEVVCNRS